MEPPDLYLVEDGPLSLQKQHKFPHFHSKPVIEVSALNRNESRKLIECESEEWVGELQLSQRPSNQNPKS